MSLISSQYVRMSIDYAIKLIKVVSISRNVAFALRFKLRPNTFTRPASDRTENNHIFFLYATPRPLSSRFMCGDEDDAFTHTCIYVMMSK